MAANNNLPAIPSRVSAELKPFLEAMRNEAIATRARLDVAEKTSITLAELLKGTAPADTGRAFRFSAVNDVKMEAFDNSVRFTFGQYKNSGANFIVTDVDFARFTPGKRTELWRGLIDETSVDAQLVNSTTLKSMDDHPPPGIRYRYWLRYASDIDSQVGPFSPVDGFEYTAQEVSDPESNFDSTNGGVFLETFQDANVPVAWTETDPANNLPTITYPPDGIVGGTVAQFAGDEASLVHNALIPFDPTILYRIRVGVRFTVAPSNPAKNKFYCGVTGVAADGSTLINASGANSYAGQHYVAANGVDLTPGGVNNWQTFTGFFAGLGAPSPLPAPNIGNPAPLFTGVKYFRPTFIVNFDDGNGVEQVDYIRIEALNPLDISLDVDLTLPSVALSADSGGGIASYAGATGTMEVRYGGALLNGNPQVTFSIFANPQALTASISSAGVYAVTGGIDLTSNSATITFRASFHGVNVDRIFSLTKTKDGSATWTPIVDIDSGAAVMSVTPTAITKVGGSNAWDSSVYSLETFSSGVYLSFRAAQTNLGFMLGLNQDAALDASYTSIDYAWYASETGNALIYESSVLIGSFGAYSTADVFGVSYDGEVVTYTKNGAVIREATAVRRTFGLDSSFFSAGAKAIDIRFGPQALTSNANNFVARGQCRYADSTIEKVGGVAGFDSDCYSTDGYPACSVTFQAPDTTHNLVAGLNSDPQLNLTYTSIDFAWNLSSVGTTFIYENGSPIDTYGPYTASTVFGITYDGETVRYLKDGIVVRATKALGRVLYFDSSFDTPFGKVTSVRFQSGTRVPTASSFIARSSCVVAGDTIEKVGGIAAWNSDVYSLEGYTEGAFCSGRPGRIDCAFMIALNTDPTFDQSFSSLDYAWYCTNLGTLLIHEDGTAVATLGAYTTSTVLAIRHVGSMVQYIKDGVVVRSVTRASVAPLFFDCSMYDPGGRIEGLQFGPAGKSAESDPNAVFLETFEAAYETRWIQRSGTGTATYPQNGLFGGKVIAVAGYLWIEANQNIQFDPTFLYRITTRIRRTVSGGGSNEFVLCGVAGYAADGVTKISEPSFGEHYNCARQFDMGTIGVNTWVDFVGYFKGNAASGFGVAPNVDSPTPLNTGIKYFRPVLILNYLSGSGTQECDYIKVERLINPSDADNTDKLRIIPDAEFSRAIDDSYWYRAPTGSGRFTTTPNVISATGGAVAGKLTMTITGSFSPIRESFCVSRRRTPYQAGVGQLFTVNVRWRRTTNVNGGTGATSFGVSLRRHNQDPGNPTFSTLAGTFSPTAGGMSLDGPELQATTVNQWQETSSLSFLPRTSTAANAAFPYLSALVFFSNNLANSTIEVDYVQVTAGVGCDPQVHEKTSGTSLFNDSVYQKINYNSGSSGTFELPFLSDDSLVGAKVFFEQVGTGALTLAPATGSGNALQSSPNSTSNRTLSGRWSRAFAECIDANTWRLSGEFI